MTVDVSQINEVEEFIPSGLIMCDGCHVARAYVRFNREGSLFHLCSHHANEHELVLVSMGYSITDRRDELEKAVHAYKTVNPDDDNF